MPARRDSQTTTEEHLPPSAGELDDGRPLLLTAFPVNVAVPIPASGEVLGRAWLAAAGIRDSELSGAHVRFTRRGGELQIEDVASRNGTFVDGERLAPAERRALSDGAVIRLGRTLVVYREAFCGEPAPASPVGLLAGPGGLREVRAQIANLNPEVDRTVLIQGETGTGKELVAAAVIRALRREKRSRTVNVAGVATGVFEAQLFGWKKGAYSGSGEGGIGVLREADGGAVFLDEIGELALDLQPKLLRAVEYGKVQPVGASQEIEVDVAIVAATNRALDDAVSRGAFRRDLLARFTARIDLPPLRARPEDVFAILELLAKRRKMSLDPAQIEVEAVERLMLEQWPANVRDLDRVLAATSGTLTLHAVGRVLGVRRPSAKLSPEDAERMVEDCGGNEREAARRYGVSRPKLRRARAKGGGGGQPT